MNHTVEGDKMFNHILLILDGSLELNSVVPLIKNLAGTTTKITAIYIIDAGWRQILGDEWLSTVKTRRCFFSYMEDHQVKDAQAVLAGLGKQLDAYIVNTQVKVGEPQKIVASAFTKHSPFDLLVIPRPDKKPWAVNLKIEKLLKKINCSLLIAP